MEICIAPSLGDASEEQAPFVSMESEIPEVLFTAMKEFIYANSSWDQYQLMSSSLAGFLYQNGCSERAVTERYLDDLFTCVTLVYHQVDRKSTNQLDTPPRYSSDLPIANPSWHCVEKETVNHIYIRVKARDLT